MNLAIRRFGFVRRNLETMTYGFKIVAVAWLASIYGGLTRAVKKLNTLLWGLNESGSGVADAASMVPMLACLPTRLAE